MRNDEAKFNHVLDYFISQNENMSTIIEFLRMNDDNFSSIILNSRYGNELYNYFNLDKMSIKDSEYLLSHLNDLSYDIKYLCSRQILKSKKSFLKNRLNQYYNWKKDSSPFFSRTRLGKFRDLDDFIFNENIDGRNEAINMIYEYMHMNNASMNSFYSTDTLLVDLILSIDFYKKLPVAEKYLFVNHFYKMLSDYYYTFRNLASYNNSSKIVISNDNSQPFYLIKNFIYTFMTDPEITNEEKDLMRKNIREQRKSQGALRILSEVFGLIYNKEYEKNGYDYRKIELMSLLYQEYVNPEDVLVLMYFLNKRNVDKDEIKQYFLET